MTKEIYRQALDKAVKTYDELKNRQDGIQVEFKENEIILARLKRTINGLLSMLDMEQMSLELGFTDAVRHVLEVSEKPMNPVEVKVALDAAGFDTSKYDNPMASIHTILRRLSDKEVTCVEEQGKKIYAWGKHDASTVLNWYLYGKRPRVSKLPKPVKPVKSKELKKKK